MSKEDIKVKAKQMIKENREQQQQQKMNSSKLMNEKKGETVDQPPLQSPSKNNQNEVSYVVSKENDLLGHEYIQQEIMNLKAKQEELDEQGNFLEKQLRSVMNTSITAESDSPSSVKKNERDKEIEDKLLKEWFLLINQKNALLHRQQELELLQNEKNLEKRYEILSNQLRKLMEIDDFNKTNEQKKAEQILFHELITLVNKRNELVIQLDEENKL
jgi:hypothetical protein